MNQIDEIRDMHMDPPGGYGAFDEDQLYDREEDAKELCEHCDKPVEDCTCYSPCCGEYMGGGNRDGSYSDYGICPSCGEHV
jgi:hypothetical protein